MNAKTPDIISGYTDIRVVPKKTAHVMRRVARQYPSLQVVTIDEASRHGLTDFMTSLHVPSGKEAITILWQYPLQEFTGGVPRAFYEDVSRRLITRFAK